MARGRRPLGVARRRGRGGRHGWLVALVWAATACTSPNPAFEATGEDTSDQGDTTLTSTGSGTRTGSVDDPVSESAGTTGPSSTGEASTDDPPPMSELCLADLLGINEAGELHLIDVDAGTTVPLPPMPELDSWALTTDLSGTIYISPRTQPNTLMVLEPVTFQVQDMLTVITDGGPLPEMARAGVDPDGMVWVGTHDTNQFLRISPMDGTSVAYMPLGIGAGGDMVFLDSGHALVPSLQGDLSLVDFSLPMVTDVPVAGLLDGTLLTGIARDPTGRLWLGDVDGHLLLVELMEPELIGAYVADTISLGVTLNDLTTMVEPPGC
jgi:hypothetical protein